MKYLFAAGGTGGHINPALAAAAALCEFDPKCEILFVGARGKMEEQLVPKAGFKLHVIDAAGFYRSLSPKAAIHNAKAVMLLAKSSAQVRKILADFQPDAAAGFGGYVSGPVLRMAQSRGIPTVIHEQNAFPGVTNKALAKRADAILLTSPEAEKHLQARVPCRVTGLPVRADLLAANRMESRFVLGLDDRPFVLSMGGSLGAKPINDAMLDVLDTFFTVPTVPGYQFMHAAGTEEAAADFRMTLELGGVNLSGSFGRDLTIRPYITDMARCLSAADLVICRAGASSLAEFQALGKPSILIPSPYVAENHQYHNAKALADRGAALLIEEKDLNGMRLLHEIDTLLSDKQRLERMGSAAKAMAKPGAAQTIAKVIMQVAKK